jgi:hypothetical protein
MKVARFGCVAAQQVRQAGLLGSGLYEFLNIPSTYKLQT